MPSCTASLILQRIEFLNFSGIFLLWISLAAAAYRNFCSFCMRTQEDRFKALCIPTRNLILITSQSDERFWQHWNKLILALFFTSASGTIVRKRKIELRMKIFYMLQNFSIGQNWYIFLNGACFVINTVEMFGCFVIFVTVMKSHTCRCNWGQKISNNFWRCYWQC